MNQVNTQGGLHDVAGFEFAGIYSSDEQKNHLGLIFSPSPDSIGAAVYTQNDVKAAPVVISQEHDIASQSKQAILINSGSANAFTGKQGYRDAQACVEALAGTLDIKPERVYLASTGCIGFYLSLDNILAKIKEATHKKNTSQQDAEDFTSAIMTTDTYPKSASITYQYEGVPIQIGATIKGSGMIMPNMATMLATVITNANISQTLLQEALSSAVDNTLNCCTVDGDTSTNDSVFLMSNCTANTPKIESKDTAYDLFASHLTKLLEYLGKLMINDGEGITKFITLNVLSTPTRDIAKKIAFSIANSPLVKTALFGNQLNWGRILMAAGKAQTGLDYSQLDITINDKLIIESGEKTSEEILVQAEESIKQRNIDITLDFHQGDQHITVWTCDFSYDYVKINADYLT